MEGGEQTNDGEAGLDGVPAALDQVQEVVQVGWGWCSVLGAASVLGVMQCCEVVQMCREVSTHHVVFMCKCV